VIEETAELRIRSPNVHAWEWPDPIRSPLHLRSTTLRSALRWRRTEFILGEVRERKARTRLESFNTATTRRVADSYHGKTRQRKALHRFAIS